VVGAFPDLQHDVPGNHWCVGATEMGKGGGGGEKEEGRGGALSRPFVRRWWAKKRVLILRGAVKLMAEKGGEGEKKEGEEGDGVACLEVAWPRSPPAPSPAEGGRGKTHGHFYFAQDGGNRGGGGEKGGGKEEGGGGNWQGLDTVCPDSCVFRETVFGRGHDFVIAAARKKGKRKKKGAGVLWNFFGV